MEGKLTLWVVLVLIRIWWSMVPQSGYIHPDEFFQTVEVVAGDVFESQVTRTWEFNSSFPLRSVVIPKLIFHPWFKLLRLLSDNRLIPLSGWTVIVCSRMIMAILSLWIDFCVYRICKHLKADYSKGLLMIASSYVTLTYQCHTFTNSFETLLFSSLVYIIFTSQFYYKEHNEKKQIRKKSKFEKSKKTGEEEVDRPSEKMRELPYIACAAYGVIVVAGVFNRPTFIIFSFLPSLWWLNNILRHSNCIMSFILQTFVIIASSMTTSVIFCLVDSLYFNNMQVSSVFTDLSICLPFNINTLDCFKTVVAQHFVFTPWNFIHYNTKGSNLAEHGLHPFYLHFCVNMPLLYGPLMFYLLKSLPSCLKNSLTYVRSLKPVYKLEKLCLQSERQAENVNWQISLLLFILTPIIIFSIFPHQEPRFLIPLLPIIVIFTIISVKSLSKKFIAVFFLFNIILATLYGIFHQGGTVPCILRLQTLYNTHKIYANSSDLYHITFSHTYMPPQFPLLLQSSNVKVLDLKGCSATVLNSSLQSIINSVEQRSKEKSRLFLVVPATFYDDLILSSALNFTLVEQFYPHISFEDPPKLKFSESIFTDMKMYFNQFRLFLLEIY